MNVQYVNKPVKPISQWASQVINQFMTVSQSVYQSYSQPVIEQVGKQVRL